MIEALLFFVLSSAGELVYSNPVIPGNYPDPSVIRVGGEYWATATSSGRRPPIYPLLRSRDLVNWRLAGGVFQEPPAWSAGQYWAPELAEIGGRFYVYYTARKRDGPLCVAVATAPKPEGPYEDHGPLVCQELGSIDAVSTRDENGKLYLIWKEDGNSQKKPTPLWAQPLSPDGLRVEGKAVELFRNDAPWEGGVVEGPFVVRRGEYFYLFYSGNACCGERCNYALGVARARRLLGPWEKCPRNPLVAANDRWKCPGHGSIVVTPEGRYFLLYHAYAVGEPVSKGRQAVLDEVLWEPDGWPSINGGRGVSSKASR
jgi:beta-xylosidase